jgi:hypothetical protein
MADEDKPSPFLPFGRTNQSEVERLRGIIARAADRLADIDLVGVEDARIMLSVVAKVPAGAVSRALTALELALRILHEADHG